MTGNDNNCPSCADNAHPMGEPLPGTTASVLVREYTPPTPAELELTRRVYAKLTAATGRVSVAASVSNKIGDARTPDQAIRFSREPSTFAPSQRSGLRFSSDGLRKTSPGTRPMPETAVGAVSQRVNTSSVRLSEDVRMASQLTAPWFEFPGKAGVPQPIDYPGKPRGRGTQNDPAPDHWGDGSGVDKYYEGIGERGPELAEELAKKAAEKGSCEWEVWSTDTVTLEKTFAIEPVDLWYETTEGWKERALAHLTDLGNKIASRGAAALGTVKQLTGLLSAWLDDRAYAKSCTGDCSYYNRIHGWSLGEIEIDLSYNKNMVINLNKEHEDAPVKVELTNITYTLTYTFDVRRRHFCVSGAF